MPSRWREGSIDAKLQVCLGEARVVRKPIVAGRFYPLSPDACRVALADYVAAEAPAPSLPKALQAGIVPHAGWMCSGRVAGRVFGALATAGQPDTVVLFGAVHRWSGQRAALFPEGFWETPLGRVAIDEELAAAVRRESSAIVDEPAAHAEEHSLEVQTPFVQWVFPTARILPIMVPFTTSMAEIGTAVVRGLRATGRAAAIIGTTDLTHYGPAYGFTPKGVGPAGLKWAREVNDQRMVDLVANLAVEEIAPEALANRNACGPGAVTATVAAALALHATRAAVLAQTSSAEVLGGYHDDAVGYVGIVFGQN
jgi:MEMO1 family protein